VKSGFSITSEEFRGFSQFLEKSCGILLAEHKQYLVQSRLSRIMQKEGYGSLSELIRRLNQPGNSTIKEQVIDAMTTNETLWFRDIHPYEILKNKLLPELSDGKSFQKLRIWSAACSTGQEPYSISMVIEEFRQTKSSAFSSGQEIVATDIASTVLDQARKGEYEMLALGRGLSQDRLTRFFTKSSEGSWQIKTEIRNRVRFQSLNLLGQYSTLGQFDIVFCRNVLIYFSSDVKNDILRKIHKQLKPGGYLILGASESLSGLPELYKMIHCRPGIIYQAV
jgi:chemotaxis protein methyltransferase CheR